MDRLTQLRQDREAVTAEIAELTRLFDAARRADPVDTLETYRLRGLIADAAVQARALDEDIEFARKQLHTAEAFAARAAGREQVAKVLTAATTGKALGGVAKALADATAAARTYAADAQARASLAITASWRAGLGEAAAQNVAGIAVGLITGTENHAVALAQALAGCVAALPPALAQRLARYVQIDTFALAGLPKMTLAGAADAAEAELDRRLRGLYAEPVAAKEAA
jgi:hypothetical protein